ncbi:unnamed protein product [Orchesella dallaii]|uniref:SCP domain-containing protein n=1 Tax=Orchesella dallaii TaxID=48710 RepID=A0ABP1PIG9_9HEXA
MDRSSSTRMALWAILLTTSTSLVLSAETPQYGLTMFTKAAKGVCWIEKLHKLPPINKEGDINWGTCDLTMETDENKYQSLLDNYEGQIRKKGANPDDYRPTIDGGVMTSLKQHLKKKSERLPAKYRAACGSYIDDEKKAAPKDFSSILGDSGSGEYAFRGLAHCLINTIETENGPEGFIALQSHLTNPKSFVDAILERENENRARHGVPAFTMDTELNTRAQRYAEILARKCHMEHMSKDPEFGENHPDLQYNGGRTGENIATLLALQASDADNGVDAANEWYTEIENYPWPAWTGGKTKGVIGHFTATVWKSSQLAGYGVARNTNTNCGKMFVVSRYSPGGNVRSEGMPRYKENVLPPL